MQIFQTTVHNKRKNKVDLGIRHRIVFLLLPLLNNRRKDSDAGIVKCLSRSGKIHIKSMQRRRRKKYKSIRTQSCNFLTDSCKFQLCPQIPQHEDFQLHILYLWKRTFQKAKIWRISPLALCHDRRHGRTSRMRFFKKTSAQGL